MVVNLNASEVFEIAVQIERNGAKFYRSAAELFDDSRVHNLFLQLADWEAGHEQVFADMKNELIAKGPELSAFEAESDIIFDAQSMAGLAVFGNSLGAPAELTGKESITDILKGAIEKEKDSIIFYTGLKDFVSDKIAREKIAEIIKEEMRHVRILKQSMEAQ